MKKLIWIGPRESDIVECKSLFYKTITIFGSGKGNNRAYCILNNKRIDHNSPNCVPNTFWNSELTSIKNELTDFKIMYYNTEFIDELDEEYKNEVICLNEKVLLKILSDKKTTRSLFCNTMPVIPFQLLDPAILDDYSRLFNENKYLIFQELHSSGGFGTHLICSSEIEKIRSFSGKQILVSPYFEESVPVNTHIIIGKNNILYFPGSVQIIKAVNDKLLYLGADYIAFRKLEHKIHEKIKEYSLNIGRFLQKLGYLGILGIDYIITKEEIMFTEINARFQASTPLLNIALQNYNLPSMQEMHLTCFENKKLPTQEEIEQLQVPYSMISYTDSTWKKSFQILENLSKEVYQIHMDGFSPEESSEEHAYLFKIVFSTNCSSITPNTTVAVYENLFDLKDDFYEAILNKNLLETKISLLNQGVRLSEKARTHIERIGRIKNAVFSAVDLIIYDNLHINCPRHIKFSSFSPWEIVLNQDNILCLQYYGTNISEVTLDLEDVHASQTTVSGIPYSRICFWATDRLRVHHTLGCCLKNVGKGCKFCEITPTRETIPIQEILDTVDFYLENANSFRHFLIGGGSEPRSIEYKNILTITNHIRRKSSKPIYLMSLPPENLSVLEDYYTAGITEIGFNVELFEPNVAANYMPGKGEITRKSYFEALERATDYWGKTGKVRSLIILGLESEDTLLSGILQLCETGVMPILSVFRPIPGTETENIVPPSNHYLRNIYIKATDICQKYNLHLGPDCPACQNNTLSLPF